MRVRVRRSALIGSLILFLSISTAALAGDLTGRVTDPSGAVVPGATVRLLNIASGGEVTATSDAQGRYTFADVKPGSYRVSASLPGFAEISHAIVVASAADVAADLALRIAPVRAEPVNVTALRGVRDSTMVPLRIDTLTADNLRALVPRSTGEALAAAPGVTMVGSGPFQMRPRLRGLDSTRVLVLIDGERLNHARTATDRAGIEVGLINPDTIQGIEVLGGAGSVLYGTDALAGTINIVTMRPRLTSKRQFTFGFDGYYSSNEDGRRSTVTLGMSGPRWSVLFKGGAERFDNYRAGGDFGESSSALLASGVITREDTVDTNFPGFAFKAFPDPFNAPFDRSSGEIPGSMMSGSSFNLAGLTRITAGQQLEVKYVRRHTDNVGFPDFAPPFFFQTITLPWSNLDKFSATYTLRNPAPRLERLAISTWIQRQDRQLRNEFPVQFPAPTQETFFPINVFRLNIASDTRQHVLTPGIDIQATLQPRPRHVVTMGVTWLRDRSEDERTTSTQMTMVGFVGLGTRGPAATVFPAPVIMGLPTIEHPVRVPNASFRNAAVFVQDEWDATPMLRLTGGLRIDGYRVSTDATPGYSVQSLVTGAVPAINPETLPDINGDALTRSALTGEAGVILFGGRPISLFGHYVRSYRHPNLEELLFSGPATTGNIVPNLRVAPETGDNVDLGARVRLGPWIGSMSWFVNRYRDFISTEPVATSPAGSISQAINLAAVRIHGAEGQLEVPFLAGGLAWVPQLAGAVTRGTVLSGISPLTGDSLAGAPQDNISPWKVSAGLRVSERLERWWASYGVRAQGKVTRVSPLLSESPFLIAQDLLALDGFAIHRLAAGYNWRVRDQRLALTLAVENLGDRFYREQFQFAPAAGRSVILAISVGGR